MHPEVYEGVSRIKGDSFNHGQQCILLIKETLIIVAWKWEKSAKNSFAERRLTAHRKSLQGKLAHDIVALGNTSPSKRPRSKHGKSSMVEVLDFAHRGCCARRVSQE